MDQINAKLVRLRWLFLVYVAAAIGIDVFYSLKVLKNPIFEIGEFSLSVGNLIAISVLTYGVYFAGGLWLFHHLLLKKRWARILLLISGWLAVIDAVTSFFFSGGGAQLQQLTEVFVPGLDWANLFMLDRVKDIWGMVYWGYAIFVLQIDGEIKRGFMSGGLQKGS